MIQVIRIPIERCTDGVYLRWWHNGWHHYCFTNRHEVLMRTEVVDTLVTQVFSRVSKIERPTKIRTLYSYAITVSGITAAQLDGFTGLLLAEMVQQYDGGQWYEVDIVRGVTPLLEAGEPAYEMTFTVTRKELPNTPAVYQPTQLLYIGDTLVDIDDDEIIPQTKQVNDIAEMQDRQSDFTAQFKVRKTRAMRGLFELSGEVGASTTFPYTQQTAKLVQDGIEMITGGRVALLKSDRQYYHIAIYSGNLGFFKAIEGLKITDLLLPSTNHQWSVVSQSSSHASDLDYVYPLCEPSDDGGITPLSDTGSSISLYAGWLWPFIKVKAIWDEIFANAGYTVEGDILTDETFLRLFMPVANLQLSNVDIAPWLYSLRARNRKVMTAAMNKLDCVSADVTTLVGDEWFSTMGLYITRYAATYRFRVYIVNPYGVPAHVYLYDSETQVAEMLDDGTVQPNAFVRAYAVTQYFTAIKFANFRCTYNNGCTWYYLQVTEIQDVRVDVLSDIEPRLHLPPITQVDFIKMVCNIFGLVPEANPRDKKIRFWNYSKLVENIPHARDWSAYLHEEEDDVEFKFGDYAQRNYLRFKAAPDVRQDAGLGVMQIDDATLPLNKDVVELPLSTCDEVLVLTDTPVSRIDMNKWNQKDAAYEQNPSIAPRLVYVSRVGEVSPEKQLTFRSSLVGGVTYTVNTPRKASSLEVAFSSTSANYATLKKMLTKTNLRRCKLSLPAYEVAGFKHDVPVYLSQYRAYFYVNKISNYVNGRLCTIELIKL